MDTKPSPQKTQKSIVTMSDSAVLLSASGDDDFSSSSSSNDSWDSYVGSDESYETSDVSTTAADNGPKHER